MRIDLQARGFTLTSGLVAAVYRGVSDIVPIAGERSVSLQVRLFDVNSTKGGVDKGCLLTARTAGLERISIASSVHDDLYQAIHSVFTKLRRMMIAAVQREQALRRRPAVALLDMQGS